MRMDQYWGRGHETRNPASRPTQRASAFAATHRLGFRMTRLALPPVLARALPRALPRVARTLLAALAVSAATTVAACGGDDPQVPSAAASTVATSTSASVASAATTPAVRITDAKGRGVKGVLVRWQVTAGGGRVTSDTSRTNASGDASAGGWTLGTVAGTQTVTA